MAKRALEIKLDEALFRKLRKEANNRTRDVSSQAVQMIRLGLILVQFCGGNEGIRSARNQLTKKRR